MRMNRKRRVIGWMVVWACALIGLALAIPSLLVQRAPDFRAHVPHEDEAEAPAQHEGMAVTVYLTRTNEIETVPLEAYVRGVVAAEMPIGFELEALKAQAIAARTYIVRRMQAGDFSDMAVDGAVVSDSVQHQAYVGEEELGRKWPWFLRGRYINKLNRAVAETEGLIATYEGEPIQAAFFSTSNGYTENSEEYWSLALPYLRSVPSPWDIEQSPKYEAVVTLDAADALTKLGVPESKAAAELEDAVVVEHTTGNRVKTVRIAGQAYTGREVREKLGLASSHFEWEWRHGQAVITTYGYGHGVGMSQYGANGMAREGKRAEEILRYYYQGVEIARMPDEPASFAGLPPDGRQPVF